MNTEFKFHINRKPGWDAWEIYLTKRAGLELFVINVGKDGLLTEKKVKEGSTESEPFMVIPGNLWERFVNAINEDLPNVKKEVVSAELESTKYHLEDMRKLVFNKFSKEKL